MNRISKISGSVLALALAVAVASPANADVLYTTGTAVFPNLGGNTPGDTLTLGSAFGTVTGPGTYTLNNVTFSGTRFPVTPTPFTGNFADTFVTLAGITNYSVPYSLQLGGSDTITLGGNSFVSNGFNFNINTLMLTVGVGGTTTGSLTANVTAVNAAVPEPATWSMMLLGFGAIGLSVRSRRRRVLAQLA